MTNNDLHQALTALYTLLRDNGYGSLTSSIGNLIYYLETDDVSNFQIEFNSSTIWGGAGSISDIEFRDSEKQKKLNEYLDIIQEKGLKWSTSLGQN